MIHSELHVLSLCGDVRGASRRVNLFTVTLIQKTRMRTV
jgi:hypothetical protein